MGTPPRVIPFALRAQHTAGSHILVGGLGRAFVLMDGLLTSILSSPFPHCYHHERE